MSVWRFFRSMAGLESGRWCRDCSEPIGRRDQFGLSEGVCCPCRSAA
jgi:hypothetical protein